MSDYIKASDLIDIRANFDYQARMAVKKLIAPVSKRAVEIKLKEMEV